jgi:hypothetical protein
MKAVAFYFSLLFLVLRTDAQAVKEIRHSSSPVWSIDRSFGTTVEQVSQDGNAVGQSNPTETDAFVFCDEDDDDDDGLLTIKKYKSPTRVFLMHFSCAPALTDHRAYHVPCFCPGGESHRKYIRQRSLII